MKDKDKNILDNLKISKSGFEMPENYLEHFENKFFANSNKLKNGFTCPDKYFQTFEDKYFNNQTNLKHKDSGFKVPKNYFNDLEEKIYTKIKSPKVFFLFSKKHIKTIGFSIAASLLLFMSLYNLNSNKDQLNIANIEVAEIENWMDEDLISFNTYEISDIFNDKDLDLVSNDNDEILDYLDDTDIEYLIFEN